MIIIKLRKLKTKKQTGKQPEKQHSTYKGIQVQHTRNYGGQREGAHNMFQALNKNHRQLQILYPTKLPFRKERGRDILR